MLPDTAACKSSTNYIYDFGGKNLLAVFDGKKVVSMFEMTKLVNGHLV